MRFLVRPGVRLATTLLLAASSLSIGCSSLSDLADGEGEVTEFEAPEGDGSRFEGDPELHKQNAISYYDAGDYFRARAQFRKILEVNPDDANALGGYAYCSYFIGFNAAAYGNFNEAGKELVRAEQTFQKVFKGDLPKSTSEGTGREWRNALGLAMTWRAMASLDRMRIDAIDRMIGQGDVRNYDELMMEQRKRDLRRNDLNQKSLALFRRLSNMQYAAPDAILNQADLELIVGNTPAALATYDRYLGIARDNIANWDRRKEEWPEQYASKKYALEAQKAIDVKRSTAVQKAVKVMVQVAQVHFQEREYADSLALLTEAAELQPDRMELNVPIAECYEKIGEPQRALNHIEAFIKASPVLDEDTRRAHQLRARILKDLGR